MLVLWIYLFAALFPSAITLPISSPLPGLAFFSIPTRGLERHILPRSPREEATIPTSLNARIESYAAEPQHGIHTGIPAKRSLLMRLLSRQAETTCESDAYGEECSQSLST